LSKPDFVLGVKEPPLSQLDQLLSDGKPSQTHLMFSHTLKGQDYNMPLLARFMKQKQSAGPSLIDYELLKDDEGKRTVGFGWFAGGSLYFVSPYSKKSVAN
jgi:alpha-aminoadipic semialdehyde synthase